MADLLIRNARLLATLDADRRELAGGWLAVAGRIEVGTVVAVVSGLGKLNDPWGDLVNWAREWSVDSVKYRLFADAVNGKGLATA